MGAGEFISGSTGPLGLLCMGGRGGTSFSRAEYLATRSSVSRVSLRREAAVSAAAGTTTV